MKTINNFFTDNPASYENFSAYLSHATYGTAMNAANGSPASPAKFTYTPSSGKRANITEVKVTYYADTRWGSELYFCDNGAALVNGWFIQKFNSAGLSKILVPTIKSNLDFYAYFEWDEMPYLMDGSTTFLFQDSNKIATGYIRTQSNEQFIASLNDDESYALVIQDNMGVVVVDGMDCLISGFII